MNHEIVKEINKQQIVAGKISALMTPTTQVLIHKIVTGLSQPNTNILLLGETGAGKTYVAEQAVKHFDEKLLFVDSLISCLSDELLPSELFGHVKGAFTGAFSSKVGLLEKANNGVLLLDEIGHLPISIQIKLLKFFDRGTFSRVGESQERKSNAKIISSTNKNLQAMMEEGTFLPDLYYRISAFEIFIPPLRDRKSEILFFANSFLEKLNQFAECKDRKIFSKSLEKHLCEYSWPGNIRELENKIRTYYLNSNSTVISLDTHTKEVVPVKTKHNIVTLVPKMNTNSVDASKITNVSKANSLRLPAWILSLPDDEVRVMLEKSIQGSGLNIKNAARKLNVSITQFKQMVKIYKANISLVDLKRETEIRSIVNALIASRNHKVKAAKALGLHYHTLCRRIDKYGIDYEQLKQENEELIELIKLDEGKERQDIINALIASSGKKEKSLRILKIRFKTLNERIAKYNIKEDEWKS